VTQESNPRLWIRADGPYGKFTIDYHHYDTVLLVGGGVGVTPCIACLRDIYRVSMTSAARMAMVRACVRACVELRRSRVRVGAFGRDAISVLLVGVPQQRRVQLVRACVSHAISSLAR
jgi:hypothetical protein